MKFKYEPCLMIFMKVRGSLTAFNRLLSARMTMEDMK